MCCAIDAAIELAKCWLRSKSDLIEVVHFRCRYKEGLLKFLLQRDSEDTIIPLDKEYITRAFKVLCKSLPLDEAFTQEPYFVIRQAIDHRSKRPPEPSLLNSFFLEDLAYARTLSDTHCLPNALKHYLGVLKPTSKTDLLNDNDGLRDLLAPALTPLGRWPGNGRFPLALLQQAAVNATSAELMPTGILAVNGPPGTGKTTLLRDVVAARVVERATALCEFEKPQSAFTPSGQVLSRSSAKIELYSLDSRLKGFEMVVSSSNNKAVENLSAELPALNAIAEDAPELRYFKSIADKVSGANSWGIIAAVLGNSKNRYAFSDNFWRDEEQGLSTYLNHACGIAQTVSEPQTGGLPLKRNRAVVDKEDPPANLAQALTRWQVAKTHFNQALSDARDTQNTLQDFHRKLVRAAAVDSELRGLLDKQSSYQARLHEQESSVVYAADRLQRAIDQSKDSNEALKAINSQRPWFLSRWLKTSAFLSWQPTFTHAFELAELVDEAGQAVPQAAVGAMIRTQQSVVVGDPLQIEPVVSLPSRLTQDICGHFGIDPLTYNAPEASVQTVADAASLYGSKLPIGSGYREVGAPLLVHRRCDNPMFQISNEIAYDNQMVQAKQPSREIPILGPSRWIHVAGESGPDKWCADEGLELIAMIQTLRNNGSPPDFYVVTPFVVVQNQLRQLIKKSGVLKDWAKNPSKWVWDHVGTVHTVQGREAPIVFFVLGAQLASQTGARNWAGGNPNLLNVAATRAKTALYVIANRELWKSAGFFSTLNRWLD